METAELILSGKEKADELIILSGAAESILRLEAGGKLYN